MTANEKIGLFLGRLNIVIAVLGAIAFILTGLWPWLGCSVFNYVIGKSLLDNYETTCKRS